MREAHAGGDQKRHLLQARERSSESLTTSREYSGGTLGGKGTYLMGRSGYGVLAASSTVFLSRA